MGRGQRPPQRIFSDDINTHPSRLCTKGSTDFMPSFFFLRLHFGGTAAPHQESMDKILLHTHTTVINATTNSMEGNHSPPPIHTQTHAGLQLIHATANATAPIALAYHLPVAAASTPHRRRPPHEKPWKRRRERRRQIPDG